MRRVALICLLTCVAMLIRPATDAFRAYHGANAPDPEPYTLTQQRLSQRVVLVVIDSWAHRILETPTWMPKLFARESQGASGVLWAPVQTGTMQGILTLATGTPPTGLAAVKLVSTARYAHWTIYDDIASRGERVLFSGGPAWVALFGDRGSDNFRETGHGPRYRDDDVQGLKYLQSVLLSAAPPTLSVIHISETDFAAHQYGTTAKPYADVLRFWDDTLDDFLQHVLVKGTTVIITADHGNDLLGSHGGSDPIYRRTPVVMLGAGIEPGNHVEMQASDMPSTIAVLLGLRAPSGVVGMPAVEGMALPPGERSRIEKAAYEQAVLKQPRVANDPGLLMRAQARLSGVACSGERPCIESDAPSGSASADPDLRGAMLHFAPELSPVRRSEILDWFFVALSFGAALMFGHLAWRSIGGTPEQDASDLVPWAAGFVLIELLFCVRSVFSATIKQVLRQPSPQLLMVILLIAAAAIPAAYYGFRHRDTITRWARSHVLSCVVFTYLIATVLRPWDTLSLLGITMVATFAYSSSWPLRVRVAITALFALYFTLGSLVLWPMLGERLAARYVVGLPIAGFGIAALAILQHRYSNSNRRADTAQLLSLGLLLVLLPAGGLGLVGWSTANFTFEATVLLALLCCWVLVVERPPWWAWAGPALVTAFWRWPTPALFSNSLATCSLLLCLALVGYKERQDCRVAAFLLLTCMLSLMTSPAKSMSLFLLLSAMIGFLMSSPREGREQQGDMVVFAALFVVGCRYAIFDLFGNTNSMLSFGLQDIDVNSAYVGNSERAIVPAVLMALLKAWLAGAVIFAAFALFRHWHRWLLGIAGLAGMFALFNIGQTSLQAALSTGPRSDQYDWAAFSVFVNTGMFIFAVLSFFMVAAVIEDPKRLGMASTTATG